MIDKMNVKRSKIMHAVKGTWKNGHVELSEHVDWPEGSELLVEPITSNEEKIGGLRHKYLE